MTNNKDDKMFKRNFNYKLDSDKFFDFIDKDKKIKIFDYSLFDKDIILSDDRTHYRTSKKQKQRIETLRELDNVVAELVDYTSEKVYSSLDDLDLKTNVEMTDEIEQGLNNGTVRELHTRDYSNPILPTDRAIIEEQVIFDILFEKYKTDSKNMNLNEYCRHISETLPELTVAYFTPLNESIGDTKEQKLLNSTNALTSSIKRHLDKRLENLSSYLSVSIREINEDSHDYLYGKKIYEDYIKLGLNPLQILAQLKAPSTKGNEKKFPKYAWDSLLFTSISIPSVKDGVTVQKLIICGKQYKRDYGQTKNNNFKEFISENNEYDRFVEMLTKSNTKGARYYFNTSMMLYHLEINQRIDYIYKLSTHLENSPLANLDNLTYTDNDDIKNRRYKKYKNFIFTTRYIPDVIRPVNINNSIVFNKYKKYYTPMLYLDEHYQRIYLSKCSSHRAGIPYDHMQPHVSNIEECSFPLNYYLNMEVRAKALELFKYHFSFKSDNYTDMRKFIYTHYNPINYHDTDKFWKYVTEFDTTITNDTIIKLAEKFPVANIDRTSAASIRKFIKRFIKTNTEVNNSIFYPKEIE